YAVLTEDEKELGVALVEVGGGSTGVTIFHEGKIRHLASLRYAGSHVTQDLVQGLGVTQADDELLKERHGVAVGPLVDGEEMVHGVAHVGYLVMRVVMKNLFEPLKLFLQDYF